MRILLVDADDAGRASLAKLIAGSSCEVDEAPDGVEAFEIAIAQQYDLIVTEATLPRLDTPELIAKVRARGVKTPIIVVTSIMTSATIGALMKQGILDYIPKILPPEQILRKIVSRLPVPAATQPCPSGRAIDGSGTGTGPPTANGTSAGGTPGAGVLFILTHESDQQRLRPFVPPDLAFDACRTFNEGLAKARHGRYTMAVIDTDADVLNLSALVAQVRRLLPEAALIGIATVGPHEDSAKVRASLEESGFDAVVFKPITSEDAGLLAERWCTDWDQLVTARDDVIEVSRLRYRDGQRERYLHELSSRFQAFLKGQSDACYDQVIVDLTRVEQLAPAETAETIARAEVAAASLGISLLVVLAPSLCAALRNFEESYTNGTFRWFDSVGAARASASG